MQKSFIYVQENDDMYLYEIQAYKALLEKLIQDKIAFHHFVTRLYVNEKRQNTASWDWQLEYVITNDTVDPDNVDHYEIEGDYVTDEEFLDFVNTEFVES